MKTIKIKDNLNLTAVFVPAEEGGYTAYIEEIRGAVSEGETLEEAESNLIDALELVLETERDERKNGAAGKNTLRKTFRIAV